MRSSVNLLLFFPLALPSQAEWKNKPNKFSQTLALQIPALILRPEVSSEARSDHSGHLEATMTSGHHGLRAEIDRGGRGVRKMGREGVAWHMACLLSCLADIDSSLAHSYADKWRICAMQ